MAVCDDPTNPEATRRKIRERGEEVRRREQARALRRLEARRQLTEREKEVIRSLAADLTDGLLAVPERHLVAVANGEASEESARVALELFGDE